MMANIKITLPIFQNLTTVLLVLNPIFPLTTLFKCIMYSILWMNCGVFHVHVNTYVYGKRYLKGCLCFCCLHFSCQGRVTEIFLYVKQGTESKVFDDNLRLQQSELNKASGCLSKIICKYRLLFLFRVFSDRVVMKG